MDILYKVIKVWFCEKQLVISIKKNQKTHLNYFEELLREPEVLAQFIDCIRKIVRISDSLSNKKRQRHSSPTTIRHLNAHYIVIKSLKTKKSGEK